MCVDEQPANPDEMILQCSNVTCQKWQHLRCVSEKALREYERCMTPVKVGAEGGC